MEVVEFVEEFVLDEVPLADAPMPRNEKLAETVPVLVDEDVVDATDAIEEVQLFIELTPVVRVHDEVAVVVFESVNCSVP